MPVEVLAGCWRSGLAEAGARIALAARTYADLAETAELVGAEVLLIPLDVRDQGANDEAVQTVVNAWGGLDVAILNAGISPVCVDPIQLNPQTWRDILDVNLSGVFYGACAAARVMQPGSRIIATGSVLGERPMAGLTAYSASKAGLVGLMKALAIDFAPRGVTVNAVAPGWFHSGLATPWLNDEGRTAQILGHTALKRWGSTEELLGAFRFLASDASSFVTGAVFNVDGGYTAV